MDAGKRTVLALLGSACLGATLATAFAASPEANPGGYIVVLRPGTAPMKVATEHRIRTEVVYTHAVQGFVAVASEADAKNLKERPDVLSVEPNVVVSLPGDRIVDSGWSRKAVVPEVVPTGVARVDANLNSRTDFSSVGIAVIDTGIARTHFDLNVAGAVSFVRGSSTGEDDNGHGTHCAGIAAARINGVGTRGVAPNARLFGVKVFNRNGKSRLSQILSGIDWVAQNAQAKGIQVVNMSFGARDENSPALDAAISHLVASGITCVVAAGNKRRDAITTTPANHPDVICVSALADSDGRPGQHGPPTGYGADDTLARFSNYGETVDVAAPGVKIYSTFRSGRFATLSGTSMAAPHVAGAAALYLASTPKATPADVKAALLNSAWPQSSARGFAADRDSYPEPLLNVGGL